MDIDPKVFLDVPLNQNVPHACSPPAPLSTWRGVVVRAPARILFKRGEKVGPNGAFAAIPICGYFRVDVQLGSKEPMTLVAVARASGKVFSGPIVETDPGLMIPPPAAPPLTEEDVKGTASGGYFNPNLVDFVPLPPGPGTYDVHVEFRQFKSNVVTIELVETP